MVSMDLNPIEYVSVAVKLGSITQAARALHLSQPALTRRIRSLEERLGTSLLYRRPRGVSATPAGVALLKQYERIKLEVQAIPEVLQAAINEKTVVRIGIPPGMPMDWLERFLTWIWDESEGIEPVLLDLASPEIEIGVLRGRIDIGLIHHKSKSTPSQWIMSQDLGIALDPRSRNTEASLHRDDLSSFTLLAHHSWEVSGTQGALEDMFLRKGINTRVTYRKFSNHASLFCKAAKADGVILTRSSADLLLADWSWISLNEVLETEGVAIATYAIRSATPSPAVDLVFEQLSLYAVNLTDPPDTVASLP